jgi:hypothetical protein
MTNGLGPARNFCVGLELFTFVLFVLGLLASLIDLKADLEVSDDLRDFEICF